MEKLRETDLNFVNGGVTTYGLDYSSEDYEEAGIIATIMFNGKKTAFDDSFRYIRGYEVTFSVYDKAGNLHEIDADKANFAVDFHMQYGQQPDYEFLCSVKNKK